MGRTEFTTQLCYNSTPPGASVGLQNGWGSSAPNSQDSRETHKYIMEG